MPPPPPHFVRLPLLALLAVLATGCGRPSGSNKALPGSDATTALGAPSSASLGSVGPSSATAPHGSANGVSAPPSFLRLAAAARGPIAVRGYPHPVRNGIDDAFSYMGFSKDGAFFAYCGIFGGGEPVLSCTLQDRAGRKSSREGSGAHAFVRYNGLSEIRGTSRLSADDKPAPLVGTWSSPDITLDVLRLQGDAKTGHFVRVGGGVAGESSVYPITLTTATPSPELPPQFAVMNGMAISPDGNEIGMVAHFLASANSDSFVVRRMTLGALASVIYNDTGFRHHQNGDFAGSAALFEKAVFADPDADLAAYNLACAWTRTGDTRAKEALAYAIVRDPRVKTRAQKDADFARVRAEDWFTPLVQ